MSEYEWFIESVADRMKFASQRNSEDSGNPYWQGYMAGVRSVDQEARRLRMKKSFVYVPEWPTRRDEQWIEALRNQGVHAEILGDGSISFKHVVLGERKAKRC